MSHSHIPIKHLISQIDARAGNRQKRDVRPQWLTDFINNAADLFEPIAGVGRVGFDCHPADDEWVVNLFLGATEVIGGPRDGTQRRPSFEVDVRALLELFDGVSEFYWSVFPHCNENPESCLSFVTVAGMSGENTLRLQLLSAAPDECGPGLHELPNGNCELT